MRPEEAAAVASLLTVSIFGFNKERKFIVPGTAIRIAPRLALTAKHVTSYIFQQLGLRENEQWPRQQKKFDGMEVRVAEQNLGGEADDSTAPWWFVDGTFPSKLTDISVLVLSPGNDAARAAESRGGFFRWSLEPPREQQHLWAYGYIEDETKRQLTYDDTPVQNSSRRGWRKHRRVSVESGCRSSKHGGARRCSDSAVFSNRFSSSFLGPSSNNSSRSTDQTGTRRDSTRGRSSLP